MGPMFALFQIVNLVLIIGGIAGFAVIVVAIWRISQSLHSIASSLRVLVAGQTAHRE